MMIGRTKPTTAQRIEGTAAEIGQLRVTLPDADDKWRDAVQRGDQAAENEAKAEREAALRAIGDLEARLPVLRERTRRRLAAHDRHAARPGEAELGQGAAGYPQPQATPVSEDRENLSQW